MIDYVTIILIKKRQVCFEIRIIELGKLLR